ncbi:MAG: hypothetical protein ACTIKR_19640 [Advenella sp.]|uniref:hypothetical protein n=1 Tax=Advenella sp. TaxID=1872388 RepID=UPI003F9826AA
MSEVDRDQLKEQVEVYKQLKQNGYLESAGKHLDSIEKTLERVKKANPDEYDDLLAYIDI